MNLAQSLFELGESGEALAVVEHCERHFPIAPNNRAVAYCSDGCVDDYYRSCRRGKTALGLPFHHLSGRGSRSYSPPPSGHAVVRVLVGQKPCHIIIGELESEYNRYVPSYKELVFEDVPETSLAFIPLILEEKVVGVLSVQSPRPHAFDQKNENSLCHRRLYRHLHRKLASFQADRATGFDGRTHRPSEPPDRNGGTGAGSPSDESLRKGFGSGDDRLGSLQTDQRHVRPRRRRSRPSFHRGRACFKHQGERRGRAVRRRGVRRLQIFAMR